MHIDAIARSIMAFPAVKAENFGDIFCTSKFIPIEETAPTAK